MRCHVDFLITFPPIPFLVGAKGHSSRTILTLNASNDVFLQPLMPFYNILFFISCLPCLVNKDDDYNIKTCT